MSFSHLHVHSHYSLLDGLPKIKELVRKAAENKMPALALTDHGVMYGCIEFYKACKDAGIKPIIGMEAYVSLHPLTSEKSKSDRTRYHLTLLAQNHTGYKNIMKLCSLGWLDGFYYKPRIDYVNLKKYSQGITILTGCLNSELNQALVKDNEAAAHQTLEIYQVIFSNLDLI